MSDQGTSLNMSNSVFNDLRLEGDFCDAVIKVQDVEFQIHRVFLFNCSEYFRALFKRWSAPDQKVFEISGLSPDMMQLIIEFAYTGSAAITEDNVMELLLAADQFNVIDLMRACCDFLREHLGPNNCIGIWQFTNIFISSELKDRAYRYIIDHFERVVSYEEFKQLSVVELTDILDRDELNVRMETTVYEAVLRWIAHKPEERIQHLFVLLSKVRLALVGEDYMRMTVMSNALVMNNSQCRDLVRDAMQTIRVLSTIPSVTGVCNAHARPRLPNFILLAIGGWSGSNPTNAVEAYDVSANQWLSITDNLEHPRAYHGSAFLNGSVYCVGGFTGMECFNSMQRFDVSTHTWHEMAPMYYRRCYVSVAVLNGCIYAMGGFDGHERLNTAECYRPETNQWSLIASMHEQRSDASCTVFNNKVYVCGGFNGNECLQSCEYYNPATNQWTVINPMISQRSGLGIIAYAGRVYAVGGFDGSNRLRSAEAYNPRTNIWQEVPSMMTTRSNFGIEVIDDRIFVVGGFNGFTTCNNVEFYDAMTNEWSVACDMEIRRSALSCCVVPRLPNMEMCTIPREFLPLLHLEDGLVEFRNSIQHP